MIKRALTKREFERKAGELIQKMKAIATPFEDTSEEAKKERIERARHDKLFFMRMYLPHYFSLPFAKFHEDFVELSEVKNEPTFLAVFREAGKSSFWCTGIPLHDICFQKRHFILIISDTEELASDFIGLGVKLEIEENERIKQDFGDLRGELLWEKNDLITKNRIRVKARGSGQRIRGLRNMQYRPDRVIVDDLENDINVRNLRLVKEKIKWLKTAVLGSLAKDYSFTMIGNLISKKCVLAQFINEKDEYGNASYISRVINVYDEDMKPAWPEAWGRDRIESLRKVIGSVAFSQEMMNNPISEEGLFREEWLRYYHARETAGKNLLVVSAIDPSMKSGELNDFKAMLTVGLDRTTGIMYILDAFIRRCSPDQLVHIAYNRYEEFHPLQILCEENALGEFLYVPFNMLAREKGFHLPLVPVIHRLPKEARIQRLSPFMERGLLMFQKGQSDQELLIEQLLYFGNSGVKDDGPDALETAISGLEKIAVSMQFEYETRRRRITINRGLREWLS